MSKEILNQLQVKEKDELDVSVEDNRIVIQVKSEGNLSLEDMLNKITDQNRHELLDFGEPVVRALF